jgi:hypothetical protein
MEQECGCFQKSEYTNNNTFQTQQEAYNYSKIVAELMNEEFCGKHTFYAQITEDNDFVIRVALNPNLPSNYNPHISCDVGCGSTDAWSLEATDTKKDTCGSSCGCS